MSKTEPEKADTVKGIPENETPAKEQGATVKVAQATEKSSIPKMNVETSAPTKDTVSKEQQEVKSQPLSFNGQGHIPTSGDIVVPFEKIKEMAAKKEPVKELEQNGSRDKKTADKADPKIQSAQQDKEKPLEEAKQQSKPKTSPRKAAKKVDKQPSQPTKPKAASKTVTPKGKTEQEQTIGINSESSKSNASKQTVPSASVEAKEAPQPEKQEQIVYVKLSELHPFKNHPFQVRVDDEMSAMVASVKDKGVTQPAIVRPREEGGYEIVSGHRRQKASELAGIADIPCIIRNLTDEQAITQMVEDNTNQRESILPSERAKALDMQLEAIKRQGARNGNGQRSNEVVAERNKMTVKQVQRYIKLNSLVPDLMKMVDEKKIAFTPAVELAFITPKNQSYIAIAIEGQQSSPSLSQAQRMRDLDQMKLLKPDVIDGIMLEEKKEVDKVIISSQELSQYFGKEKTPREMKDTIIKLLNEWKEKQPELAKPEKKTEKEK
ncbi:ParB/RepB/Spo0J family partition protein [Paenibacillus sp. RS8]|uniref:ParB/RepB/Spo0J family partition protein n=1 Tax=Paenibacillus sp. RS8 TaxID=3242681 RepID=UPI0035C0CECF